MNCPKDQTELNQIVRKGVIIDYCPKCSGVWLDRGELDKIVERSEENYRQKENIPEDLAGTGMDLEVEIAVANKSHKGSVDPSYLAGLFDLNTVPVNERSGSLKSDDIK